VIGLLELEDGTVLVGIGESLRPFQLLYEGTDGDEAKRQFDAAVEQHTSW
jgi:hypothetical protein